MSDEEIWMKYPEVLHYTNFSTALLILHSATLRATRFDLLNDIQEIEYAKNLLIEKILEGLPDYSIEQVKYAIEALCEPLGKGFYITSFCGKTDNSHRDNGLLGMWRYYGADGGCAIAFKTHNIYKVAINNWKTLEIPPACIMNKVIYKGENDNDKGYLEKLNRFLDIASDLIVNPPFSNVPRIASPPLYSEDQVFEKTREMLTNLLCLLICSKHPAFFEEHEVRIGLTFIGEQAETQGYIKQPYHEIPFSLEKDISRIIIGPHKDQKERYNFLKSYLSQIAPDIQISMSEIPLKL